MSSHESPAALQSSIEAKGEEIFALIRSEKRGLAVFDTHQWTGRAMGWAMGDPHFKTQLLRFVDVLPALRSTREITRHLREYLGGRKWKFSLAIDALLSAAQLSPPLAGWLVKRNVSAMAGQFIAGRNARAAIPALRKLRRRGVDFTVDILGEAVVSDREAAAFADAYLDLIDTLAREMGGAPPSGINVSVKISALDSQIHPADPEGAIERLKNRLRPLLLRARELGVFINFDMENYALKNLTLRLFRSLLDEPEFAAYDNLGIVIQAYLRDSPRDLDEFIEWAKPRPRAFTVRLVKGAYWDYETIVACQRGWPVPVFQNKAGTDANYERLTTRLLENDASVCAAFGTHNIRSIAHAIARAEALGVTPDRYEFQMLYGMAGPMAEALLKMGHHVREYCPVGELIPGMGYLVRRLLENTSNEGFLHAAFADNADPLELLRDPAGTVPDDVRAALRAGSDATDFERFSARLYAAKTSTLPLPERRESHVTSRFQNEPPADFTLGANREKMRAALHEVRAGFGKTFPLVVDGEKITTPEKIASLKPANPAEIIGHCSLATREHADRAVEAACRAFEKWSRTPAPDRAALLENAGGILRRRRFELAALEVFEAGKNWAEADGDVTEAIDYCFFYASEMRRLARPSATDDVPGETNMRDYIPRGVGAIIAPWNFPLAILCGMTSAALVTGNCAIMKPAEQTSVLAFHLMEVFREAGFPPGVVQLLTGSGAEIGAHLCEHPRVDFIAFTGSKEVGLKIYETAGRTRAGQRDLKKIVCEMGGKNALIIDSDADLDEAIAGIIQSAFGYSGQKCSALSRLIVLEAGYERVVERLVEAAASLVTGPPEHPATTIGPVIGEEAFERITRYIETGKTEAKAAYIGNRQGGGSSQGFYIPPVIFTDVPRDARIAREEIFGPVLCVFKVRDLDEAIALANDTEFALTGGIYSRSPAHIGRVKNELAAGNIYINRPITGAIVRRQPFGGFRMSGGGTKAGGTDYLLHFLLPRVITENVMRHGFVPEE